MYHKFQRSHPSQVLQRRVEDLEVEKPAQAKQVIIRNSWAQSQANQVALQNQLQ